MLRYPHIDGANEKEQLKQIKSFLIQLVDELNFKLTEIDTKIKEEDKNERKG